MSPKALLRFVPSSGAFAVLRIDPVASLAHLQDPAALQAAENVQFNDYIVYVGINHHPRHPTVPFHNENVKFVVQGTPVDIPDQHIEASMFIPIFPASGEDDPNSPRALVPEGEFPWPDCFLSPFLSATVRTKTIRSADPIPCRLGIPERARCDVELTNGWMRQCALRDAAQGYRGGGTLYDGDTYSVTSSCDSLSLDIVQDDSTAELSGSESSIGLETVKRHELEERFEDQHKSNQFPEQSTMVELLVRRKEALQDLITAGFTHDLSTVTTLNSPLGFFKEAEEISRYDLCSWITKSVLIERAPSITRESVARKFKQAQELKDAQKLDHRTEAYRKLNGGADTPERTSRRAFSAVLREWRDRIRGLFC
ncbi:hypothetical protein C8F01DRAFT_1089658 [Mycena amicta]|nr:hypothetical protein C8F01DRAFT_1089658 [Mycena amicta]